MAFVPANKILIKSDNNILELENVLKKNTIQKEDLFVYRFTRSETKLGMEVSFTEVELKKNLRNNFKEI